MENANFENDIHLTIQKNNAPIIPFPPVSPDSKSDSVDANALLDNGIILQTNTGQYVLVTVEQALGIDIGGSTLSEEDFQNVATQLLKQQNANSSSVAVLPEVPKLKDNTLKKPDSSNINKVTLNSNLLQPLCMINIGNEDISNELLSSKEKAGSFSESTDSEAASMSGNGQAPARTAGQTLKRRGGWPKGRKRKPELPDMRPPKAPATAYVLFLNERRKLYKDIPFTEVTKLLGNEWSKLKSNEKHIYLQRAAEEKKRYRQQLKAYWQSDIYQAYLVKKRTKNVMENMTEESSDMDATDEFEDEDNEDLYCRTCDQWFNSLHNKKEHLYGRQHFQMISRDFTLDQLAERQNSTYLSNSTSLDESSMDGSSLDVKGKNKMNGGESSKPELADMTTAITGVMNSYQERESEIRVLQSQLKLSQKVHSDLKTQLRGLEKKKLLLIGRLENLKEQECELDAELCNLLWLPSKILEIGSDELTLPYTIKSYSDTS